MVLEQQLALQLAVVVQVYHLWLVSTSVSSLAPEARENPSGHYQQSVVVLFSDTKRFHPGETVVHPDLVADLYLYSYAAGNCHLLAVVPAPQTGLDQCLESQQQQLSPLL